MQRMGMVIGVKPDMIAEYRRLHAAVWPEILALISDCNIRNYTIFLRGDTLFSYYEYVGTDHAADQARIRADPATSGSGCNACAWS